MNALLIAATVAVVSSVPSFERDNVIFRENRHIINFNVPVVTQQIEIIDSEGCKVSQDSRVEGNTVIVEMKACRRIGYPVGEMKVKWRVNGETGEYDLHILHHH